MSLGKGGMEGGEGKGEFGCRLLSLNAKRGGMEVNVHVYSSSHSGNQMNTWGINFLPLFFFYLIGV